LHRVENNATRELRVISEVKSDVTYRFDQQTCDDTSSMNMRLPVLKSTARKVVSLSHSSFMAKSIIRKEADNKPLGGSYKVPTLITIVPSGAKYAFDIITEVGIKSYLQGSKLTDIQADLKTAGLDIALSSLYEQQRKFLFYLGALHRQSADIIRSYFQQAASKVWLLDGTLEEGTPVFFGIKEVISGIMLDCWKIPTENEKDISDCLTQGSQRYGNPDGILHDLSSKINTACQNSLLGIPHGICHFHFTRVVGDNLYEIPHDLLAKRMKQLKLKIQLKEQRKGQTAWLREAMKKDQTTLIIRDLLTKKNVAQINGKSFGREIYLAINDWILDFADDGNRQGFPFDPYLLYFQRRIRKAYQLTQELIDNVLSTDLIPDVMINFRDMLKNYLNDTQIIEAENLYEKANEIFGVF